MGSIKAEKLQAMKKYRKTQFAVHNLLHLVAGILLICSLSFSMIPSICSSMRPFLLISLPCIWSSFFNPKCLFIVVNVIVIFLVGESGFVGSKTSRGRDVYDEYIERNRSRLRGVSVSTTPQDVGNEDKEMDTREVNEEFGKMKEEEELFEVKEVITCEAKSIEDEITCAIGEEDDERRIVEADKEEELILNKRVEADKEEELLLNKRVEADKEEELLLNKRVEADKEEVELPAEELNKRVEDFIARVNKQRWMEAQFLVSFKA